MTEVITVHVASLSGLKITTHGRDTMLTCTFAFRNAHRAIMNTVVAVDLLSSAHRKTNLD